MSSKSRQAIRTLPALALLLVAGGASAEKLVMPNGMGGVPDIGSIPCVLFIDMIRVAPAGTRHSLITWSAGYLESITGKPLQETVNAADRTGPAWTYQRLGDELEGFCRAKPDALTREAVFSLAGKLGVSRP